jgi:hypothetical protein
MAKSEWSFVLERGRRKLIRFAEHWQRNVDYRLDLLGLALIVRTRWEEISSISPTRFLESQPVSAGEKKPKAGDKELVHVLRSAPSRFSPPSFSASRTSHSA